MNTTSPKGDLTMEESGLSAHYCVRLQAIAHQCTLLAVQTRRNRRCKRTSRLKTEGAHLYMLHSHRTG